mmetsp:Transcript_9722/g.14485  ORF Transcript_9722/g.14485 Transcript_9722/m.14485 type:complete len:414 (-) Transcript_9722:47-1288(-)
MALFAEVLLDLWRDSLYLFLGDLDKLFHIVLGQNWTYWEYFYCCLVQKVDSFNSFSGLFHSFTMEGLASYFDSFIRSLKRSGKTGTFELVRKTAEFIQKAIGKQKFKSQKEVKDLVSMLTCFARELSQYLPLEIALVNVVRRVLHIIREECTAKGVDLTSKRASRPRHVTLTQLLNIREDVIQVGSLQELKNSILLEVGLLIEELESHIDSISEQAPMHIHANEVILTYGKSDTVESFLESAKDRNFEVIVAEAAPHFRGHMMAKNLSEKNIAATLIPDSAVYALMSRVNKVIIGTHALMANGGLLTFSGTYGVCLAAQAHSVPVLVACGLYKLSPLYPFDQDTYNEGFSPALISEIPGNDIAENVNVSVPAFDYIPPELVSLYITNIGGHNPSYLYRLLSEYYSQEDYDLAA